MRLRSDLVRTNNCDIIKPVRRGGDESDAGAKAGSRDLKGEGDIRNERPASLLGGSLQLPRYPRAPVSSLEGEASRKGCSL